MSDSDDSDQEYPSPYLATLYKQLPKSRKPVLVNTSNPLNPATAYPALHIAIDAKPTSTKPGAFPMKSSLGDMTLSNLVTSALQPSSIAAISARNTRSIKPLKNPSTPLRAYQLGVDSAPGRETPFAEFEVGPLPSSKLRNAATVNKQAEANSGSKAKGKGKARAKGKGKGKRPADEDLSEVDSEASGKSGPKRRKEAKSVLISELLGSITNQFHRRTSKVPETSEPSPTADPKLLSTVDDIFASGKTTTPTSPSPPTPLKPSKPTECSYPGKNNTNHGPSSSNAGRNQPSTNGHR